MRVRSSVCGGGGVTAWVATRGGAAWSASILCRGIPAPFRWHKQWLSAWRHLQSCAPLRTGRVPTKVAAQAPSRLQGPLLLCANLIYPQRSGVTSDWSSEYAVALRTSWALGRPPQAQQQHHPRCRPERTGVATHFVGGIARFGRRGTDRPSLGTPALVGLVRVVRRSTTRHQPDAVGHPKLRRNQSGDAIPSLGNQRGGRGQRGPKYWGAGECFHKSQPLRLMIIVWGGGGQGLNQRPP